MNLRIRIIYAAFRDGDELDISFTGRDVEQGTFSDERLLAWLFRQFNAVDGDELLSVLALRVPSLSVGDCIEIMRGSDVRQYRCDPDGWARVL